MKEYYLLTFGSTHAAIATDHILKPIGCTIMPVPRFISASCGISIRIMPEQREEAESLFKEKSTLAEGEYSYYHVVQGDPAGSSDNSEVVCDRIPL